MSNKKLTELQWENLRDDLSLYSPIFLLIDGIPFVIREERDGQKIVLMVYICGLFRGQWFEGHHFTKYLRHVKKQLYSKKKMEKMYKIWKKLDGKKAADEAKAKAHIIQVTPIFPSLKNFRRHIHKVADRIEVISDYQTYKALSDDYKDEHPEYFKRSEAENG